MHKRKSATSSPHREPKPLDREVENNVHSGMQIDDKTRKYDRQLRLWKQHGQDNLEKSHVLLVGASPAGVETLKNLVLPGIE